MNRLPSLTAAEEPTKLASVTAAITSVFSPAWWPWSAVTVIVVVTIPAGHIRQSSSPASTARLRASACTRSTARTFCTSIATAAHTGDTAASVRLRSGRLLASERGGTRHQARERGQLQDGSYPMRQPLAGQHEPGRDRDRVGHDRRGAGGGQHVAPLVRGLQHAGPGGVDAGRPGVEQGLGEATGCRAQVECDSAGRIDPEGGQGAGELDRPPQGTRMAYPDGSVRPHPCRGLAAGRPLTRTLPSLDQPGGIVQAGKAALEQGEQRDERGAPGSGHGGVLLVLGPMGGPSGQGGPRTKRSRQPMRPRTPKRPLRTAAAWQYAEI